MVVHGTRRHLGCRCWQTYSCKPCREESRRRSATRHRNVIPGVDRCINARACRVRVFPLIPGRKEPCAGRVLQRGTDGHLHLRRASHTIHLMDMYRGLHWAAETGAWGRKRCRSWLTLTSCERRSSGAPLGGMPVAATAPVATGPIAQTGTRPEGCRSGVSVPVTRVAPVPARIHGPKRVPLPCLWALHKSAGASCSRKE